MSEQDLEARAIGYIRAEKALSTKPNVAQLAEALGEDLDVMKRTIRSMIDRGAVSADRTLPGDDGYWASGLTT